MSRYIDAEILLDAMRHITLGETDVARSEMKIVHYICHMPHFDDVRENVRGEWRDKGKKWTISNGYIVMNIPVKECSVCGKPYLYVITDRFCPNCGAQMVVEGETMAKGAQDD